MLILARVRRCRLSEVVEECSDVGIARIDLVPDPRQAAGLQVACDKRGFAGAGRTNNANGWAPARLVQLGEQPIPRHRPEQPGGESAWPVPPGAPRAAVARLEPQSPSYPRTRGRTKYRKHSRVLATDRLPMVGYRSRVAGWGPTLMCVPCGGVPCQDSMRTAGSSGELLARRRGAHAVSKEIQ